MKHPPPKEKRRSVTSAAISHAAKLGSTIISSVNDPLGQAGFAPEVAKNTRPKKRGGPNEGTTSKHPRFKKGAALESLSNWLLVQYARHQVLFAGLCHEADRLAMVRLNAFIAAVREVQK